MAKKQPAFTEKVDRPPVRVPRGHLLGAHMSIAGGTPKALERARALGATALQLFVKNNNRWQGKKLTDEEASRFRELRTDVGNPPCVAHNCYLINLASPRDDLWEKSVDAMVDEVTRCHRLGIEDLVTHPGAHLGAGEAAGIDRILAGLLAIFERTSDAAVRILMEVTAGQGSAIGHRFEHIAEIVERSPVPDRIGVCLDTAHAFAAGYDLRTSQAARRTFAEFERIVGLAHLRALHLNDSKRELGSRVDRHEHIGEGQIGLEGFRWIMRAPELRAIPKLLETPKGDQGEKDWDNMERLIACL